MNQQLLSILYGTTERYPYALESQFPHILEEILLRWHKDEIEDYFTALMISDRDNRTGFPPDVASDIMYLSSIHSTQGSPD
ncbi:MAG: hypothetical protein R8K48_08950 [Gallionella sp.]